MFAVFIPAIVVAYFIGSIPCAHIIAKLHGKDVRTVGSGNVGATNLARACGRKWGYTCFALDVLKGFLPTIAAKAVALKLLEGQQTTIGPGFLALWMAVGVATIVGHIFPIYLKFKGGKGVATSFGMALGLWPYLTVSALVALLVWVAFVLLWRYVSLASIAAAAAFPVTLAAAIAIEGNWTLATLWPIMVAATVIPILVIFLHRSNIKRLLAGTESKIRNRGDRTEVIRTDLADSASGVGDQA